MYVCICNAITDRQIREAARSGAGSLWALQQELGVSSNCGNCRHAAMDILREEIASCEEIADCLNTEEPAGNVAAV
jgi:bacterioferritin-associated ferredoxin